MPHSERGPNDHKPEPRQRLDGDRAGIIFMTAYRR